MAEQGVTADRHLTEPVREGVTMALSVCIVLAAEFVALGDVAAGEGVVVGAVWGTTMGLALAHVFAFDLTARLAGRGTLGRDARAAILLQLAAAAGVALVVTIPFLGFTRERAVDTAGFIVATIIGVTAFGIWRVSGAGLLRSGVYALVVLVVAILVVLTKVALSGH